ncbi:hypothetical protein [uncultured Dialister sp.]|uniref:hypothetical protein n=1 Tax=uncultured Dialister sp. TaxID=278064 RepID=UPI0025FE9A4B|nr:hypothetical protein [uncultured Dialister sp.]
MESDTGWWIHSFPSRKASKKNRKWNSQKFVFSIFRDIMGIERDSWHPWSGKRLSQNILYLKGAFLHWKAPFKLLKL